MKLDPTELVKELEAEVEEKRLAYEEAKSALAFLRKKYGLESSNLAGAPKPKTSIPVTASGHINLSELNVPESKPSLAETVSSVIRRFGDQEFNVGHIYAILEQTGEVPDVKSPKASIAQALSVLEKRGEVRRTFKGSGNTPHRFKRLPSAQDVFGENIVKGGVIATPSPKNLFTGGPDEEN